MRKIHINFQSINQEKNQPSTYIIQETQELNYFPKAVQIILDQLGGGNLVIRKYFRDQLNEI
jgi:hypothetical protein